jgi:hypothetical protein
MTDDEPKHLIAVVDTVRFASRDNPITEIKLRTGRGGSLKNSLTDIEEQQEDTGLPVIIGGTNASGKTSLLRGIQEVCNLLQLSTITKKIHRSVDKPFMTWAYVIWNWNLLLS